MMEILGSFMEKYVLQEQDSYTNQYIQYDKNKT